MLLRTLGVFAVGVGLAACFDGGNAEEPEEGLEPGPSPIDEPGFLDGGFVVPQPARLQKLITADRPPPPLSGGTLAVAQDGSVAVAADPDRDLIYVVRPGEGGVTTIKLATGSEPGRVALDGRGHAHVALRGAGALARVDLNQGTVVAQTAVCSLPRGVAYDATRDAIVVACASGELVTVSAAEHAPIAKSEVGLDARDVVVGADGSLSVSRYRSAELLRVGADGTIASKSTPSVQHQSRFAVEKVDVDGGSLDRRGLTSVTMSPALAWKTARGVDGTTLMLHQQSQDDEVVITGNGYGAGCETITQASVTRFAADGTPETSFGLAPHGLVVDVAISADGKFVALAEPGGYLQQRPTFELIALASVNGMTSFGGIVDAGFFDAGHSDAGPVEPVPPPEDSRDAGVGTGPVDASLPPQDASIPFPIFDAGTPNCISGAQEGFEQQVTSVAFDGEGNLYVLSREPAELIVYEAPNPGDFWPTLIERARFEFGGGSVRDTGHELFHADVGSGLSCAGCHGEALDDGHVWNFRDFGPRRTQTMRGGLLSTLPLHWEGDLPTFKHLVDEVMTRRMGGFTVEEKYGDALAKWLDQLPALKLGADAASADAVQRGKALFDSSEVACASCHSGPHTTNNQSYNVGTGELLQVPTLSGIALHPPFMHDGCAATLRERFDPACGGGDRHGHTSHLTDAEIADLIAYLETL